MVADKTVGPMTDFCNCHIRKDLDRSAASFVFRKVAVIFCSLILAVTGSSAEQTLGNPPSPTESAQIPVMVRDSTGRPVRGLTASDFVVFDQSEKTAVDVLSSGIEDRAHEFTTYILIVIAPMEISGRANALHELDQYLTSAQSDHYQVALLDSSGQYYPFSQNLRELKKITSTLASKPPSPQYPGGPWLPAAAKAIEELGLTPGRRVIVTFTDYESKSGESYRRNPNLLRVDPMMLVSAALRARASIYSVQTFGPTPVVPFGSAASSEQYSASGPALADRINSETVHLGEMRSQLLFSSALTGGKTANDLNEAIREIKSDIDGYYIISFKPNPLALDGEWHSLKITTRFPHLNVSAAHFYQAPLSHTAAAGVPRQILAALNSPDNTDALPISLNAWLFPNHRGAYSLTMSADINPPTSSQTPKVYVYTRLRNETVNVVMGKWTETLQRSIHVQGTSGNAVIHWQQMATVFPGSYTLKIAAMDDNSNVVGTRTYRFMVHSFENLTVPVSSLVIASSCLADEKRDDARRVLQSPLQWHSCELTPSSQFVVGTALKVLVRLYPRDPKFAKELTSHWSARFVVDNMPIDRSHELTIAEQPDGTVTISSEIETTSAIQQAGNHQADVVLISPKRDRILLAQSHFLLFVPHDH